MSHMPILEVIRGSVVESMHYGAFVVADSHGNIHQSCGSENVLTFLRSSAKPFQVVPLIEAGGVEHFGFSEKQVALMCASHTGSDEHVAIAQSIQERIGVSEDQLVCGTHPPGNKEVRHRLIREGLRPTANRHNCSGKHSGMLALSALMGESAVGYSEPDHPVQQRILATMCEMFDLETESISIGIDGCSVPTFAVPLHVAAIAFARLADPKTYSEKRQRACGTVWNAMTNYPHIVGGDGRFDTQVMRVFKRSLLAKGGAEGYQGMAIAPGTIDPDSPALGIALKISDGDRSSRGRGFVSVSMLKDLGLIEDEGPALLSEFRNPILKNQRNLKVGELRTVYEWIEAA